MIKKLLVLLIVFIPSSAIALTWHTGPQIHLTWAAVDKILPDDVIKYVLRQRNIDTDVTEIVIETADLDVLVTVTVHGEYYFAIQTKRILADGTVEFSGINWSTVNGESTPELFGLRFYENVQVSWPMGFGVTEDGVEP